jgi:uncharacterized protein YdaU (DUF1376 family)
LSFAYLPFYTGDYLRETRHLSPMKHGVYMLLLMHCWDTKGPAPSDEQELCGIANCRSADEVDALRYVLSRFFTLMADGYYQERMQKEVEKAQNISRVRSSAGAKGYEARVKHLPSKSQALASTHTIPTSNHTNTSPMERTEPSARNKRGSRLPEDWKAPQEWLEWARGDRPQWSMADAFKVSLLFRDHWLGNGKTKVDWLATWRNWVRRERNPVPDDFRKLTIHEQRQDTADQLHRRGKYAKRPDESATERDITGTADRVD